jgi:hypothetical protein
MIRYITLVLAGVVLACGGSDQQPRPDAKGTQVAVFVQCVVSTQRNGDPRGPVTYEEWEQTCKNSPSSAELSTYLAVHSDVPRGLVSFLQALAIREDERRAQTH